MTISTGTFLTFAAIGNREDLIDTIFNIDPTDTPFQANIGKTKATAVLHEWQTDGLAAASSANAQLEGDDVVLSSGISSATPTTRLSNYCQIARKTVQVSGTQDAVSKAGRKKEIVYQMMKKNKELRRDLEKMVTGTGTYNAGNSTTARTWKPLRFWYQTNTSLGTSGVNSSGSSAAADGTQRALTEPLVKSMIQAAWTVGGEINMIMPGPFNKQVISSFTGNNTRMQDTTKGTLATAIDIYKSDFGTHRVVPNKFSRDRDLHLLTTDLWAMANLRPIQTVDLAKTGDAERGMLIYEGTLEARNEAGSAIVADLTTS
jgi:hypothetical protein